MNEARRRRGEEIGRVEAHARSGSATQRRSNQAEGRRAGWRRVAEEGGGEAVDDVDDTLTDDKETVVWMSLRASVSRAVSATRFPIGGQGSAHLRCVGSFGLDAALVQGVGGSDAPGEGVGETRGVELEGPMAADGSFACAVHSGSGWGHRACWTSQGTWLRIRLHCCPGTAAPLTFLTVSRVRTRV